MNFEVGLFRIAVVLALGQAFGEIDMLYLVENAIGNLQGCEMRHAVGVQAGLFAKLAARHGIRTGVGTFPGSPVSYTHLDVYKRQGVAGRLAAGLVNVAYGAGAARP